MNKLKIDNRAYSVRDYELTLIGKALEFIGAIIEAIPKWAWALGGMLIGFML